MGQVLARLSQYALPLPSLDFNTATEPENIDLRHLGKSTGFSYRQVEQLKERFEELCRQCPFKDESTKTLLTREDLLSLPDYKKHPLRERIVDVFMQIKSPKNQMEFKDFLETISLFRSMAPNSMEVMTKAERREYKLKFLFEVYDITNDGTIDANDMHTTAKKLYPNEEKEELVTIAEALISEMDADQDGKVSFEDFCTTFSNIDIDSKVSVPFLNRKI